MAQVELEGSAVKVYDRPVARCQRCGRPARVRLEYANAWLCDEHFLEYVVEKVRRNLTKYNMVAPGQTLLLAVSGGKDSVTLLDALDKLAPQLGIRVVAVHIVLGLGKFSEESLRAFSEACSRAMNVKCLTVDLKEVAGFYLPDLLKAVRRPACSVCGLVKRYILNAIAAEVGASSVATGHHLNDLLAYVLKNFLLQEVGQIAKLGPVDEAEGSAVRRVRPLFDVYEDETRAYVHLAGLRPPSVDCPYKPRDTVEVRLKEALDSLERGSPSMLISSIRKIASNLSLYSSASHGPLGRCKYCGMPASGDVCGFCSMTKRVFGRPLGPEVLSKLREKLRSEGLAAGANSL